MKKWMIAVVVVVVAAVGVGCFFGGRATAGSGAPTVEQAMQVLQNQFQNGSANGFPGANGTARRGGVVSGSIIAADASSITVKTTDGSSAIVLLSSSTTVSKVSDGALADLTTGQNVIVTGTTNTDGTVTATGVQVGATLPTSMVPSAGSPGN